MEGLQPRFSPKCSTGNFGENKNIPEPMVSFGLGGLGPKFPKFIGRTPPPQTTKNRITCKKLWGKSGLKMPIFPMVLLWPGLPINLGKFGPQATQAKGTTGKIEGFQASTFPRFVGESSGENLGWKPQFPYGYLWPAWEFLAPDHPSQRKP